MKDCTRYKDWTKRLVEYLALCHRTPYAPGRHDCALFAAGAVQAMCGLDPAQKYRGRYRTLAAGLRLLRRDGFADHVAMTAAILTEIPVAMAQPGDIAVVPGPDGDAMGVVQGARIYVLRYGGMATAPLTDAARAFAVGRPA